MISATQFVCAFKGGSNSALFKCSDGQFYVLKCQGFVGCWELLLCTEFLTCKLTRSIGLPTPDVEIVQVDQWLIDHSAEMTIQTPQHHIVHGMLVFLRRSPCRKKGGLQLSSRYLVNPGDGKLFDYFPEKMLSRVGNLNTFAGALVFDLWMNKVGARQAVFCRSSHETHYSVAFRHQGWVPKKLRLFDCAFDPARVAMYVNKAVYRQISGWDDFEPYLSRIEAIDIGVIEGMAEQVPECWRRDWKDVRASLKELHDRKGTVPDLLARCLVANPDVFPNWSRRASGAQRKQPRLCSESDLVPQSGTLF